MNKNIYRPPVNKEQDKKIQRKLDKNAILRLSVLRKYSLFSQRRTKLDRAVKIGKAVWVVGSLGNHLQVR